MTRPVLASLDPRGVASVTLNRPEVNNAYNGAMIEGLLEAMDELAGKPELRVVLLKGNGKHFQAGADLKWIRRGARRLGRGERTGQPRHGGGRRPAQPSAGADRGAGARRLLRRRHRHDRRLRRGDRRRQRHLLHRRGALGPDGRDHHPPAQRRHLGPPAAALRAHRRALRRRRSPSHRTGPSGRSARRPRRRRRGHDRAPAGERAGGHRRNQGLDSRRAPGAASTAPPSTRSAPVMPPSGARRKPARASPRSPRSARPTGGVRVIPEFAASEYPGPRREHVLNPCPARVDGCCGLLRPAAIGTAMSAPRAAPACRRSGGG